MEELNIVLRALGKRKASGPDAIPAELLQNAPYVFRLYLLDHYNHCFQYGQAPSSWLHSEVVMLVKNYQKDTKLLSNYRPISLTNTMYQILCFPPAKNDWRHISITAFVLRNLVLDRAGRLPNLFIYFAAYWRCMNAKLRAFHAIFLDWAKAFDSVTFSSIQSSLEYMGVPAFFQSSNCIALSKPYFHRSERVNIAQKFIRKLGVLDRAVPSLLIYLVLCSHTPLRAQNRSMLRNTVSSPVFLG